MTKERCEFVQPDGAKCGEVVFKRSYCETHYSLYYNVEATKNLQRRSKIERLADLDIIPSGYAKPANKW